MSRYVVDHPLHSTMTKKQAHEWVAKINATADRKQWNIKASSRDLPNDTSLVDIIDEGRRKVYRHEKDIGDYWEKTIHSD